MAGQIIISNIKTDSDNAFSILANTGAVLFSANLASGITTGIADSSITNAKLAGSITGDKITVGSLAGNVFTANTITGDKIGQNSISSNNIVSVNASVATVGTLPIGRFPSGTILQTVVSNPAPAPTGIGTASWTEVNSNFRVTITPKNASSTLVIFCNFNFGGGFTSVLSHFKIYDITNNADVNLHTGAGSRTPMHGSARQVDSDVNDVDQMELLVSTSAGSTTSRTYSLYTKNESGTTTKYFFGTAADSVAIGVVRPMFIVYEIAP